MPSMILRLLVTAGCTLSSCAVSPPVTAVGLPCEGPLAPFLTNAPLTSINVFDQERFPNVVVALDGTVVALFGSKTVHCRRSSDGGRTFGPKIVIANPGFHGGGALVDETTGALFAFSEDSHPPSAIQIYRSEDSGTTWQRVPTEIRPDAQGHLPSMHMNETGITLRRGPRPGRLLRAARYYGTGNARKYWPTHYTTAIYSDDRGATWQTSHPFPENGTGEAAVAELHDGTLYYNSRVHWPEATRPKRRRSARSTDGGTTWRDYRIETVLPDGCQHRAYGCMGGLVRLPVRGRDILLFSNLDTSNKIRERVTVWASFDGGLTWPRKRLVHAGPSAYSSLAAGRPGTPTEGLVFLLFEEPGRGARLARFNLAWILGGASTGDGAIPDWVSK